MIVINKIKKHYFLLLSTFLFFYVFFNFLDGERGLISYFGKKEQYNNMLNLYPILQNMLLECKDENLVQ